MKIGRLFVGRGPRVTGAAPAAPKRRTVALRWLPWIAAELLAELARRGYSAVIDVEVRVAMEPGE